jgi:hypothetical protein
LFKLRNTWQEVFPRGKLYTLDVEVHTIDPKWPIISPQKNGVATQQQQPQRRPAAPQVIVKSEPKPRSPIATENSKDAVKRPAENVTNGSKGRIFVNPNFVKQEPQPVKDQPLVKDQPPEKKRREKSPLPLPGNRCLFIKLLANLLNG